MGSSIVTLKPDNTVFDLEADFLDKYKTASVSCSGGIESTLLLHLAAQKYGVDNVHALTGFIKGRRQWESVNAGRIAKELNITNVHVIDKEFEFLSSHEQKKIIYVSKRQLKCDVHYIGEAWMYFAFNTTWMPEQEEVPRTKDSVHLPFIRFKMKKANVIDLYFQQNIEELLYQTHSCTIRGSLHCGECYCCMERVKGFSDLGKKDKARYNRDWDTMVRASRDPALLRKNWF